jgi:hypothetical protein
MDAAEPERVRASTRQRSQKRRSPAITRAAWSFGSLSSTSPLP